MKTLQYHDASIYFVENMDKRMDSVPVDWNETIEPIRSGKVYIIYRIRHALTKIHQR